MRTTESLRQSAQNPTDTCSVNLIVMKVIRRLREGGKRDCAYILEYVEEAAKEMLDLAENSMLCVRAVYQAVYSCRKASHQPLRAARSSVTVFGTVFGGRLTIFDPIVSSTPSNTRPRLSGLGASYMRCSNWD